MKKKSASTTHPLTWLYIIASTIAGIFALLITIEKLTILVDPTHVPPCNVNPFLSCKTIMETPEASVFGFPNPLIGIAGFAITATIGFALLAGASFKPWFWKWTMGGLTFALGFVFWLFYESVFDIGALCLYCMAVWAMTIPLFSWTLFHLHNEKIFTLPGAKGKVFTWKAPALLTTLIYAFIIGTILVMFWDSWVMLVMYGI